jgi:hypothetical protein
MKPVANTNFFSHFFKKSGLRTNYRQNYQLASGFRRLRPQKPAFVALGHFTQRLRAAVVAKLHFGHALANSRFGAYSEVWRSSHDRTRR